MSSPYRVEISPEVRTLLHELAGRSRTEAREVALLLLRLEREPEPPGSRQLEPILVAPLAGERIWERPDWTITYQVDRERRVVLVAAVERMGGISITVFIPSVDREGRPIAQEAWTEECLAVVGRLFRGATGFPPSRGVWRDDAQDGLLAFDDTVLVTFYVDPGALTHDALAQLRIFLHRFGREANQAEVGVGIEGNYYQIEFPDPPAADEAPGA